MEVIGRLRSMSPVPPPLPPLLNLLNWAKGCPVANMAAACVARRGDCEARRELRIWSDLSGCIAAMAMAAAAEGVIVLAEVEDGVAGGLRLAMGLVAVWLLLLFGLKDLKWSWLLLSLLLPMMVVVTVVATEEAAESPLGLTALELPPPFLPPPCSIEFFLWQSMQNRRNFEMASLGMKAY